MQILSSIGGPNREAKQRKQPIVWFEIPVSNLEQAREFYGGLFGWEFEPFVNYDENYLLIRGAEESVGGALVLENNLQTCGRGPVLFVAVEDLEGTLGQVLHRGGTIAQGAKLITVSAGRFAVVHDPDGNRIGLWTK